MMVRKGDIVIIENKIQLKEYLRNKDLDNVLPISLSYDVEKILFKLKIKFKTEEDYEIESYHKKINSTNLKELEKIFKNIEITYRRVKILDLFYGDLYHFLSIKKRYLEILKRIIKKEKPSQIYIFKNKENFTIRGSGDIYSDIADKVHPNIKYLKYTIPKENKKLALNFLVKIQSRISKFILNFSGKKNKIFLFSTKSLSESVLRILLKNKNNRVFRCCDESRKSFFVKSNYIPFYKFTGKKDKNQIKLKKDIEILKKKISKGKIWKKIRIPRELIPAVKNWFDNILEIKLNQTAELINEMITLFKKKKINFVLFYQDVDSFPKALATLAKKYSVPSMVIQHGICGHRMGYTPLSSDYFSSIGLESEKRLVKWGIPKKRIVLNGAPQFDHLIRKGKKSKEKIILYIINADDDKKVIPGHLTKRRQKEIIKTIISTMKKFPDYKLIVKSKKGWKLDSLPKDIAKRENFKNIEVMKETDNKVLMNRAKAIIIHSSAMGLEGMILKKPIISLFYKDLMEYFPFGKTSLVKKVYNQKQLESEINKIIKGDKESEKEKEILLEKQAFKLDGKASQRVANLINKMIYKKLNTKS